MRANLEQTVREIQINQARILYSTHGRPLTKYLQARQDWRPSLLVKTGAAEVVKRKTKMLKL